MSSKKFDLGKLEGKYRLPKLTYVTIEELDLANELRLWFEIFLSIGLTIAGTLLSQFNMTYFVVCLISIGLATFFGFRYMKKYEKMRSCA